MSEVNFSVTVDLSDFLQDHRKLARVFIKSGYKSVADLHERIAQLFGIDNFYITAAGHFLPLTEDIRILKSDEKIRVNIEPKKRKRKHLVSINDRERQDAAVVNEQPAEEVMEQMEIDQKPKKSKRKKKRSISPVLEATCQSELSPIKKLKPSSISVEELSFQPKNTLPSKVQEQKPDTVRLSRLTDTVTSYQLRTPLKPSTSEYLAEKRVNVVKIEVVHKANKCDAELNSNIEYLSLNDTSADGNSSDEKVKTVNGSAIDQKEASNYTKIFLDQKVANTPTGSTVAVSIENGISATDLSLVTSPELSSTNTPHLLPRLSSSEYTVPSKKKQKPMIFTGVGALVEQMRSGCSTFSDCSEELPERNITKRKRIRKRKRLSKKEAKEKSVEDFVQPMTFPTPIKEKSGCHIKFSSDEIMEEENCQIQNTEPETERDLIQNVVELNKDIMGDENIKLAPLMEDQLEPKPGDIIAFKILKLTNSYAPEISDMIIGSVQAYTPATKAIVFKILRGHNELEKPTGKLTLLEEETKDVSPELEEFVWTDIIQPKLLYP